MPQTPSAVFNTGGKGVQFRMAAFVTYRATYISLMPNV